MKRFILPIVFLGGLVSLLAAGLGLDPREVPSPLVGKPVPEFVLPSLSDSNITVSHADLKGQPYLFNVWASWCTACVQEHGLLVDLAERGVNIVGLNYKDAGSDAKSWLAQRGNPYKVVLADESGRVGIEWGVYGVPETFVIDAAGVIRYKHVGPLDAEAWQSTLAPLMQQLYAEMGNG